MSNEQHELSDQVLDRAAASLRDMVVPDGPSPLLIQRTLARLEPADEGPMSISRRRPVSMTFLSRLAVAALFIIAFGGLMYWFFRPDPSSFAFAQVLDRVRQVQAVVFSARTVFTAPDGRQQTVESEVTIAEPSRMRQEIVPDRIVMLFDFREGQTLTLYPEQRQALVGNTQSVPVEQRGLDILSDLKQLGRNEGKSVGEKQIAGQIVAGFSIVRPEARMTIWVDRQTRLPVEIEKTMQIGGSPRMQITMTRFRWDPSIDESILHLTPPPGYEVRKAQVKMGPLTEQDIISALKTLIEIDAHRISPGLGMTSSMAEVGADIGNRLWNDPASVQWRQKQARLLELMSVMGRGVAFGQVVERVRQVQAVILKGTTAVKMPDGKEQQTSFELIIAEPSRMRQNLPGGTAMIFDFKAGQALMLDKQHKSAVRIALRNVPAERLMPNIIEEIRKFRGGDGKLIGERQLGGERAQGFSIVRTEGQMTIWVSPRTQLPVEVEMQTSMAGMPAVRITMSEFRWNPEVDEALLSTTPPEGYELRSVGIDMGPLGERDVINADMSVRDVKAEDLPKTPSVKIDPATVGMPQTRPAN